MWRGTTKLVFILHCAETKSKESIHSSAFECRSSFICLSGAFWQGSRSSLPIHTPFFFCERATWPGLREVCGPPLSPSQSLGTPVAGQFRPEGSPCLDPVDYALNAGRWSARCAESKPHRNGKCGTGFPQRLFEIARCPTWHLFQNRKAHFAAFAVSRSHPGLSAARVTPSPGADGRRLVGRINAERNKDALARLAKAPPVSAHASTPFVNYAKQRKCYAGGVPKQTCWFVSAAVSDVSFAVPLCCSHSVVAILHCAKDGTGFFCGVNFDFAHSGRRHRKTSVHYRLLFYF